MGLGLSKYMQGGNMERLAGGMRNRYMGKAMQGAEMGDPKALRQLYMMDPKAAQEIERNRARQDMLAKKQKMALSTGGGAAKRTKIYNNGSSFQSRADGSTVFVGPDGQPLQGKARIAGIKAALDSGVVEAGNMSYSKEFNKQTGKIHTVADLTTNKKVAQEAIDNAIALEDFEANMPKLVDMVSDLGGISSKMANSSAGRMADAAALKGGITTDSAKARARYVNRIKSELFPLLRATFGAAFTKPEGDALLITLGDPDSTHEIRQEQLASFIEAKEGELGTLQRKAGKEAAEVSEFPNAPAIDSTVDGFTFKGGDPANKKNWSKN